MNSESAVIIEGYSILLILQIFMILERLGVIAFGVMLIVSLSSATEGELLQSEFVSWLWTLKVGALYSMLIDLSVSVSMS